jgi:hypothetical protein
MKIAASIESDTHGQPCGFSLALGSERTLLEPGKSWTQLDHFKWVTRGVIEPPQSFSVHPDGSVSLNGELFRPGDPNGASALAEQINKRHIAVAPARGATPARPQRSARSGRVEFSVRRDPLGHLLLETRRGEERAETGLRGIPHLIADGWMIRPQQLHIDPLQRYIEIDGTRIECTPEGAHALESLLNEKFAPAVAANSGVAIHIRENPAAATGFDIHFHIIRAGTRFEIKGHLAQEKLDILQDSNKCDLLQPGIILRISPPFLYIRRRRADGGEEHIPGLPDLRYRGVSATELQRVLNHPLIRGTMDQTEPDDDKQTALPPDVAQIQVNRHPSDRAVTSAPAASSPSPVAAQRLETSPPGLESRGADPVRDPAPAPPPVTVPASGSAPAPLLSAAKEAFAPPAAMEPSDPTLSVLFAERDPNEINLGIFRQLSHRTHTPVQDLLLSLPRVFNDRRFEILDFTGQETGSVLDLRGDRFYGFYLTHISPGRIDLVYACYGTHIEWGPDKCAVQPSAGAETIEFRGAALRGLAQDAAHHFVFLVHPRYRDWIRANEKACALAMAHFMTAEQWAAHRTDFPLIWPIE